MKSNQVFMALFMILILGTFSLQASRVNGVFIPSGITGVAAKVTQSACASKNPFIRYLQEKQVGVLQYPQAEREYHVCKAEWSSHGTCCDQSDVMKIVDQDAKDIKFQAAQLKAIWNKLHRILTSDATPSAQRPAAGRESHPGERLSNTNEKVRMHIDTCWDEMKVFRESMLCSACSGRGQKFFKSKSVLIDLGTCQSIINSCKDYFTDLDALVTSINRFIGSLLIAQRIKRNNWFSSLISEETKFLIDKLRLVVDNLKGLKVPRKPVDTYSTLMRQNQETSSLAAIEVSAPVCTRMANRFNRPVSEAIDMKQINQALTDIFEHEGLASKLNLRSTSLRLSGRNSWDGLNFGSLSSPELFPTEDNTEYLKPKTTYDYPDSLMVMLPSPGYDSNSGSYSSISFNQSFYP